jgi:hypothetical protein
VASDLASKVREIRLQIESLDLQRDVLQGELDEIIQAAGLTPERRRGRPKTRTIGGRRPIREGSMLHFARLILAHTGRPVHVDDLLKNIRQLSGKSIEKSSLVSSLSRFVRAGDTFTRPSEGLYGLTEFDADLDGAESLARG